MIRLNKPEVVFDDVSRQIQDVFESGQLTQGKYVREFERKVAEYVGVKHAIATTSATTALHLSLEILDIKKGDEVLVSDFTFPATGNVICQTGATPILVDSKPNSFDLCLKDLEKKITTKSKAIMVVDPFGQPVDIDGLINIATQYNLPIIEDAACAIGAKRAGKKCGAWASLGVFSFHPRKLITTGEGGMITTNDDQLAELARTLLSHGSENTTTGRVFKYNGFNYRLPELSAIVGIEQMNKIDRILHQRRKMATTYLNAIKQINDLVVPLSADVDECTFQSFVVLLDPSIDRDQVIEKMGEYGIETTIGTYALHTEPAFSKFGYKGGELANSNRYRKQALTLPLHGALAHEDIDYIIRKLKESCEMVRKA